MNALVFQSATLNPVRQNDGQIWVTASDLSKALDYKQSDATTKIFNRNADEFDHTMTQVVESPRTPNLGVRIFSLRGAHLIAMFATLQTLQSFSIVYSFDDIFLYLCASIVDRNIKKNSNFTTTTYVTVRTSCILLTDNLIYIIG